MTLLRLKVTAILKELDRYETAGQAESIAEGHLLYSLMEDLKNFPLGGEFPPEARRLWQALRVKSTSAPEEAIAVAHQLHDCLTATYLDTPRLSIDLDSETLT